MTVIADEPLIVTTEAVASGAPDPNNDYIAVPLTIEIVDPAAAARGVELPHRQWITAIGAGGYLVEGQQDITIPGFPLAGRLDLTQEGTHHVYDIIDTSAYESGQGAYRWSMVGSRSGGAYWR